jgi:uncharacterized protein (DUF1800 family)
LWIVCQDKAQSLVAIATTAESIGQREMEVSKPVIQILLILFPLFTTGCLDNKNSAPEAADDSATVYQGRSAAIDVLGNDQDKDHDPLVVVTDTAPSHGTIVIQDGGLIVYQHDGSTYETDSFTYLTYDGDSYSAPARVNLTILVPADSSENEAPASGSNRPPVAADDQARVENGGSVSIDLLGNDTDPERDSLRIESLGNPSHGEVTLESDGTVTYRHDGSDSAHDSFSYTISDGELVSAGANVSVTITAANHPPSFIRSGSNAQIPVETLYTLSVEAQDPDGDELTYTLPNLPYWLHFSPDAKTLSGQPSWAELGNSYLIALSVSDGDLTIENRFTLTVVEQRPVTDGMAHRLLLQTTYGPTLDEIEKVKQMGIVGWIDNQLSMKSAYTNINDGWPSHLQRTRQIALRAEPDKDWLATGVFNESSGDSSALDYQMAAWWDNALGSTAPGSSEVGSDQLRQRVAYALSQLLVTSDSVPILKLRGETLAAYYDILAQHAFGNYRTLLGEIARSPAMGVYLSHQGNGKANPTTGARPDENFARELMQLFTIGLYQLNLDGSPDRDGDSDSYPDPGNNLLATYTQRDIEELAKVMTGWDLAGNGRFGRLHVREGDYTQPMVFHSERHEDESASGGDGYVRVLGQTLSLDSGADGSGLDGALDLLFAHPNVAPYVSRHLIQRLVTSNPSPDYLARVASVFNDNGNGVKGDLGAVVRAILLDPEARDDRHMIDPSYGKAKEPLLGLTQLLRAVDTTPLNGWSSQSGVAMNNVYWFRSPQRQLGQAALRSPSVFNFYSPDHIPRDDRFTSRSLVAPELQIQTDQMLIEYGNLIFSLLNGLEKNRIINLTDKSLTEFAGSLNHYSEKIVLTNLDAQISLFEQALEGDANRDFASLGDASVDSQGDTPRANAIDALLEHLDLLLLGERMPPQFKAALKHYLLNSADTNRGRPLEQVRTTIRDAITMIVTSSEYMTQK